MLLNSQSFNTAKYDVFDVVEKYDIYSFMFKLHLGREKKPISFKNWNAISKSRENVNPSESTYVVERTEYFKDEYLECVSAKINRNIC